MAITLITGPANAGKAQVIFDALAAHCARSQEPVLVLPTQLDVEHYRRELAERELMLGVRVQRFDGLIEQIARRTRLGRRPVANDTRRWMIAALVGHRRAAGGAPDALARGLVNALARFVAELESEHVTPARLQRALRSWTSTWAPDLAGGYVSELGDVYQRYQRALARLGWADPELYAALALDALRGSPASWRATPVLFYGFDDLTVLQLDAIETLGRVLDAPVSVSLAYEPARITFAGRAGAFQALLPLAAEHIQLPTRNDHYEPAARVALHHLERSLFESPSARIDPGGAVRLLEGGGERAELELVAEQIKDLLDQGVAPGELAVVHRAPATIAPLLDELFRSREIPYSLPRPARFANTAIGGALIGLLRCAIGQGDAYDLLRWLRTPGLLERPELADRLELRVRHSTAHTIDGARALWESENWRLEAIDQLREASQRGLLALMTRLERELEWLFCAPRRRRAEQLENDQLDEARALACARATFAQLGELTRGAPDLTPAPAELLEILQRLEFVGGEAPTPERVAVTSPLALRARRVKALFLCGLQEGTFPAPAPGEDFLTREQRRTLSEASGLRLGLFKDALASERYLFYACISRPLQLLVLSWHTATDEGSPSAPSLFLKDVCDLFDHCIYERRKRRALGASDHRNPHSAQSPLSQGGVLAPLSDPLLLSQIRERAVSASALENWIGCPVRWFVERLLRAKDINPDPEPLLRGALTHAALRDVFEGLRLRSCAKLTQSTLGLALELLKDALDAHAGRLRMAVAQERLPGVLRRLQADLERYLTHAAEMESPLEVKYLELPFGFPDEGDLGVFDLGEGVRLRGRIDRIDVDEDGHAVLYDYKGKNAPGAGKWISDGNIQIALYMRAAEDLLGLDVLGGFYQPLSGRDLRARGAVSSQAPAGLATVRADRLAHTDFKALIAGAATAAQQAAGEVARGELEPRPATCDYQGGCRYPTICRCEL